MGRPQLGRLVISPFVTIGVIAAVLVWEIEHVGSILLSLSIAIGGIVVGIAVARRLRSDMSDLADHYEALLTVADDASRRAETANRVRDEFLTTLSHELRTPLNSILGWTRLLGSGKLDAPQSAKAIAAIERAGWAQSRLIEDLLDVSQIIGGKLQIALRPTNLQPLLQTTIDALRPAIDAKRLTVVTAADREVPTIAADPDRLQQIVWNLVSNAIKFTPAGGRIDVSLALSGPDILLSVRDTGVGFNAAVAGHLFERFSQGDSSTTRVFGGLGLGLGIVRHLVELHGGTVSASSAVENQGSLFEVRIPARPVEGPSPTPRPASAVPSLRGVSVLVVDDDPQALEFVRQALELSGATVVTASSAREAKDRFDRQRPDVILSDLLMPEMDGLEFMREIRAMEQLNGSRTPAAALTALVRTDDRSRALSAGFQMHLAKPIDPSELVITVERLAHRATPRPLMH